MKANTNRLFKMFWGTSAKELLSRVKQYSDDELLVLFRATDTSTGGPQRIQHRLIVRELIKRTSKKVATK